MLSLALRMMQGAPSPSCSQVFGPSSKQDIPSISSVSMSARATRNSVHISCQGRGERLTSLVAQAVRSDQQVPSQY